MTTTSATTSIELFNPNNTSGIHSVIELKKKQLEKDYAIVKNIDEQLSSITSTKKIFEEQMQLKEDEISFYYE